MFNGRQFSISDPYQFDADPDPNALFKLDSVMFFVSGLLFGSYS